jgi:hypothetical protein
MYAHTIYNKHYTPYTIHHTHTPYSYTILIHDTPYTILHSYCTHTAPIVPVKVRDVWAHTDNGTVQGVLEAVVPAVDSVFLLLTAVPPLLVPARSDGEGRA